LPALQTRVPKAIHEKEYYKCFAIGRWVDGEALPDRGYARMMSNKGGLSLALAAGMLLSRSRSDPAQTDSHLNQLPSDVRQKIGADNAQHVFEATSRSVRP
jgi:hypothetical protein